MDDFYVAYQEKIQSAPDPLAAIDELTAISLHDLPKVQLCKFAEQAVTLLSVIFQEKIRSSQDLTVKYKQVRQQLDVTLDYMERIMGAEKEFPSPSPGGDGCWW